MNTTVLAQFLDRLGVNPATYSLSPSATSEGFVLKRTPQGWEVSEIERGESRPIQLCNDERDACWTVFKACVDSLLFCGRLRQGDDRGDRDPSPQLAASTSRPHLYVTPERLHHENLVVLLDRLGIPHDDLRFGDERPTSRYSACQSARGWRVQARDARRPGLVATRVLPSEEEACWTLARWMIEDVTEQAAR